MATDKELLSLLKATEKSLKPFVTDEFQQKNAHLLEKYSDQEIHEVFKYCLLRPSGKSWSPMWQAMQLIYQAAFSESYLSHKDRFVQVGNYIIHRLPKNLDPVIYSFGIGTDITFDVKAASMYQTPIFMYDPTPAVIEFMKDFQDNKRLKFVPEGVYTEDTTIKFFTHPDKANSSIYPIHGNQTNFVEVPVKKLETIMRENGHDRIDILKMDVEGVADKVIEQMIDETPVRPLQIVTEFEVRGIENPITYLPKIAKLMSKLQDAGYEIFNQLLTRKASIELIVVQKSLLSETRLDVSQGGK